MQGYNPQQLEAKWQKYWKDNDFDSVFKDNSRTKYYVLEMFPYPSGSLHMGHMRVYTIGDVLARFLRMRGYNVLHPMGWDAFGLPAENAAIENGVSPRDWTFENIKEIRQQQKSLGLSYDWNREVTTCHPDYYRWTQWLFLLFYRRGLAYRRNAAINWCPYCETVLANEQVENGCCWRCESEVVTKELEQWFLRITDYAERLLQDLDLLEGWPERVKIMQRNWIGKSYGTEIVFPLKEFPGSELRAFTTRPDTLFGVTYMVIAPEHPMVNELVKGTSYEKEVMDFVRRTVNESEMSRTGEEVEKTGLFTGRHAINPVNGEEVPVLVGNYVLMEYGTGAVMGVPAHDQRDFLFAQKYGLPVKVVINPYDRDLSSDSLVEAHEGPGYMVNSAMFNGLDFEEGKNKITEYLEQEGKGEAKTTYRLRDWLISRQRYWGAPIPVIYCDSCGTVPVPEEELPVTLPENVELAGDRVPALSQYNSFVQAECPACGSKEAKRETDTMDTFMCSSWYFLRYTSPDLEKAPFSSEDADYWMPVDQYIGGIEHAVLHLLYARFFMKVLYDAGMVNVVEPFSRLLAQGMVYKDGAKMSKSKGNVVTPNDIINHYGADTGRLFILFASPPEKDLEWSEQGVEGAHRFLKRVYRLLEEYASVVREGSGKKQPEREEKELRRSVHTAIKKVTGDIEERFNFNTAISAIMEMVNSIYEYVQEKEHGEINSRVLQEALEATVLLLSPFSPHIAEECWRMLGYDNSVLLSSWPEHDPAVLQVEEVEVVVQVNGKVREKMMVPAGLSREEMIDEAYQKERIQQYLKDREVIKAVAVPGKLVNLVVSGDN